MSENLSKCSCCGAELPPGPTAGPCPRCAAQFLQATQTEALGGPTRSGPRFTPPPAGELASLFPQLEILELVGQGGMGAVYKARQKELDRVVALKILPSDIGHDASFAERFAREAKALARLNHPGIVTLYEFGRAGNGPSRETEPAQPLYYFLMEFVNGVNLRQVLERGRMSPREALAIVPQICDALQYAHDQGIVHRDIKPENILLDRQGHVKVADFGLAKLVGTAEAAAGESVALSAASTGAGTVMGTPQYMAPEQREHPTEVDHRADIYSLGVVFYQMLTGELPAAGKVEAPSRKVIVDVRLDEVVLRTLEREPERRYQQAGRVKEDVETIASTSSAAQSTGGQAHSSASAAAIEKSRRGLQVPAIGLIISGVIDFLPLIAGMLVAVSHSGPIGVVVPLGLYAALGGVVIVGALRMLRFQAYGLAVAASILAMFVFPGFLLGVPFGIWALIVLTRKEVRKAFRSADSADPRGAAPEPIRTPRRVSATKSLLIAVVSLLLLVAVVLGALLLLTRSSRLEAARISAVNQRLAGEVCSHLAAGGYAFREVQVAVYSPGFRGGECTIFGLQHTLGTTGAEGGLTLRHDGSGIWFFTGWGALSNMQFQVDAAYEMGLRLEPQLTFGPVIEQVVTGAIDFDNGKLTDLPLPPSASDGEPARYDWLNSAEGKAWMRERGIDALDANRGLIRVDMLLIKLKDQEWKSLTADALGAKLRSQAPATDVFNTRINTYGFQTREGREGMLQVVDANLAQGVKIRYKLVDAVPDLPNGATAGGGIGPHRSAARENPLPESPASLRSGFEYEVQSGDTLSRIVEGCAKTNVKVTIDQILKANPGLKPERLRVGQKILIPAAYEVSPQRAIPTMATTFRVTHRPNLGQAILDAARDFVEEHQWKMHSESGNTAQGLEMVKLVAYDISGKRVTFEDAVENSDSARFAVTAEPGAELSAERIGAAVCRRVGLATDSSHDQRARAEAPHPSASTPELAKAENAPPTVGSGVDAYPMHSAARRGEQQRVAAYLQRGSPVDTRNAEGQTLLHLAAAQGHQALAGFLLAKGAALDAIDKRGRTPLAEAMANCHDSMSLFLASKGANPALAGRALGRDDGSPTLALSLKIRTLQEFEKECREPGVLLDSPHVCLFAPKRRETEAGVVFPYLVKAYDELHRITGVHTFNKLAVYAFPAGNTNVTGGTSGPDSIEYDESCLDLPNQEEWTQYRVPHVSGLIEEMAHCFVTATRAKFGWEMLGWSLGVEVCSKVANNPKFARAVVSTREEQERTFERYLAAGCRFPDDLPANLCDRIHAWILYDCARAYGPSFWSDFYSQVRLQRDALFDTVRQADADTARNARCRTTVGCFDELPGLHFSERLNKAGISLTTDVKSLKPEAPGWNRRLGP